MADQTNNSSFFNKFFMTLLALAPVLMWYDIGMPLGLGPMLLLLFSIIPVLRRRKQNVLPQTFWIVFVYVCVIWSINNGVELWTLLPPGGWLFFSFFMVLMAGVLCFDFDYLKKVIRIVTITAVVLFWVQYILLLITGSLHFCFVPRITDHLLYQDFTYSDIVSRHLQSGHHPCSIFIEKSYMAYYLLTYLSITLFDNIKNNKWFSKESIIIIVTLLLLRSGSGIVGLMVLLAVKAFNLFWNENTGRRILLLFALGVAAVATTYIYLGTEAGQEVASRQAEITTEETSGYARIMGGYIMFDQLSIEEQFIGITMSDATNRFGWIRNDGTYGLYINGVQTILMTLGYLGLILYVIFYGYVFRKVPITYKMCIIILLTVGLLESNYLNVYMMLLTVIPCGMLHYKQNDILK